MKYFIWIIFLGVVLPTFAQYNNPIVPASGRSGGRGTYEVSNPNQLFVGIRGSFLSGESGNRFFVPFSVDYTDIEVIEEDIWLTLSAFMADKDWYGGQALLRTSYRYEMGLEGGAFYVPKIEDKVVYTYAKFGRILKQKEENRLISIGGMMGVQKVFWPHQRDAVHHSDHLNFDAGIYGHFEWFVFDPLLLSGDVALLQRFNYEGSFSTAFSKLSARYEFSENVQEFLLLDRVLRDEGSFYLHGFVHHNSTVVGADPISLWTFSLGVLFQI